MGMSESPSFAPWSTVAALPDYLLLAQTAQLARHEQALQILVLDHLCEIEARRLHLTRGYGSLFDYVVHELDYTAAAAWRRIKAMRLCRHTGGARELLQDGSLNLSNAAQLQNLFERSDRSRGRTLGSHGTGGGLGAASRDDGAPGEPAPAAPMHGGARDPAPGAGPVLDAAAREKLVRQAAGKSTREVQQMLAEVDPELAQPSDRMRALGNGRWELKAVIDSECRHGLEKLLMLRSHQDPHLTLGALVARLVRDGLERYDPERPRRVRRTGGGGSVDGERWESTSGRRDRKAKQRRTTRAKSDDVERRSEVERDDPSSAAVAAGVAGPSAPKRDTEAEHSGAESGSVQEIVRCTDSAPKLNTNAEHGSTESAVERSGGGHSTSPAPDGGGRTVSAARRDKETERRGAESGAVGDIVRCTDSAPKRVGQDADAHTEEAQRLRGAAASEPGRYREAEHNCGPPKAMRGNRGWAAALPKPQGRAGGDGRGVGVGHANCAAGLHTEVGERSAMRAPVRGRRRFTLSAAKRLAYGVGHGAAAPGERSPALERHLAALSCLGALPGVRSRYIPAAVKREVWRRDQGCCIYVDRHSGRRCGSRYRLEIDHVVPFALGGASELSNLRLCCSAHHKLRHAHRTSVPAEARRAPGSTV